MAMLRPGQALYKDEYYEIKLAPGKGNGAFAIKNIPAGTKILVEAALFIINLPEEKCDAAKVFSTYLDLKPAEQRAFDALPTFGKDCGQGPIGDVMAKFSGSNFETVDGTSNGCYIHSSRFNHSCLPNCAVTSNPERQYEAPVVKDVAKGEELTFCYVEHLQVMTTAQRQVACQEIMRRDCKCDLCLAPKSKKLVSDLRRVLMRHLYLYSTGVDLAPNEEPITRAFIAQLYERDEKYQWPLAWGYHVLIHLAEAEGLIGKPRFAMLYTDVLRLRFWAARYMGEEQLDAISLREVRRWLARGAQLRFVFDSAQARCDKKTTEIHLQACVEARRVISRGGRVS